MIHPSLRHPVRCIWLVLLVPIVAGAARQIAEALRPHTNWVASVTWQPPWLEDPAQMAQFLGYLWFNQPPQVFGRWTNQLSPEELPPALAAAREQLATSLSPLELPRLSLDPLGLTRLPTGSGGLIYGTINVISMGFAAILLGRQREPLWLIVGGRTDFERVTARTSTHHGTLRVLNFGANGALSSAQLA
jgi:hypothetical protein